MEQDLKFRVIRCIGKVYDEAKESKLDPVLFDKIQPELQELSSYFRINPDQAFLVAMIFALNYKDSTVDITDLGNYLECNPMKILEYSDDLKELCRKDILRKTKSGHRLKVSGINDQYVINENITAAVINNQPLPELKPASYPDSIRLLERIYDLGKECDDGKIEPEAMLGEVLTLVEAHDHFLMIHQARLLLTSYYDIYLFLRIIWNTLTGDETTDLSKAVDLVSQSPSLKVYYVQSIISGQNDLVKKGLLEVLEARFFNESEVKLTDLSRKMMLDEGITLIGKAKKKENIVEPGCIADKQLFFNEDEERQLDMLRSILHDEKHKQMLSRLEQKKLPRGLTVLLYGPPGTGKTESVYQIAKMTGREIMRVEISQTKSMWFGESEKVIKRVFTTYQDYARQCEVCPILLFNEADAVISRRKDIRSNNIDQTENAIQNIILEELENFQGILIATTNLVNNLDAAFERRFLFKVRLSRPEQNVKAKIWKSRLLHLTEEECARLAGSFDFSGGQIENIVRKYEISGILNENTAGFKEILEFCMEESLTGQQRKTIGFNKS
jgi:hypothetical protein